MVACLNHGTCFESINWKFSNTQRFHRVSLLFHTPPPLFWNLSLLSEWVKTKPASSIIIIIIIIIVVAFGQIVTYREFAMPSLLHLSVLQSYTYIHTPQDMVWCVQEGTINSFLIPLPNRLMDKQLYISLTRSSHFSYIFVVLTRNLSWRQESRSAVSFVRSIFKFSPERSSEKTAASFPEIQNVLSETSV